MGPSVPARRRRQAQRHRAGREAIFVVAPAFLQAPQSQQAQPPVVAVRGVARTGLNQPLEMAQRRFVVVADAVQSGRHQVPQLGLRLLPQDLLAQLLRLGQLPQREVGIDQPRARRGAVADALEDGAEVIHGASRLLQAQAQAPHQQAREQI